MSGSNIDAGTIDRVGPTRRPRGRAVMRQTWSRLLFLHWEVDPAALRPLIPAGLELDLFEGRAYVGLVPFTMSGVRPVWAPAVPWLSNFHETNVRTYVHRAGREPGVWFFSLDAANPVAVRLARALFHLPYFHARMGLEVDADGWITYRSERLWPGPTPATSVVQARPTGPVDPAVLGTLEHFLAERYVLYAERRGRLFRGRVHHTPYPLRRAEVGRIDENLLSSAGINRPPGPPLAHFAEGVRVEVFPLKSAAVASTVAVQNA